MPNPSTDQLLHTALQLHQSGRAADAAQIYHQILTQHPHHPEALHRLGVIAAQARNFDQAEDLFRRSLAASPQNPVYHYNLGNVLRDRHQYDAAAASYRQALQLKPNYVEALYHLGITLRSLSQFAPAAAAFRQALQLNPNFTEAHCALGNALWFLGQFDSAIASYRTALQLKPGFADAWGNLAIVLKDVALHDQAIAAFRQALALNPGMSEAHGNLLLALHYHPESTPESLLQESLRWAAQHAQPLQTFIQPHTNDRNSDRRLRIGYVSPDFRMHVAGRAFWPLLAAHDHQAFEVFCYAGVAAPDAMTSRMAAKADVWRNILGLSDAQVAQLVRDDQIDILVDLSGHTAGGRLLVFAHKPAPVQLTWLGYPGTTGMRTMDYRITSAALDPPGANDACYVERLLRLPETVWCYEPGGPTPEVVAPPALATSRVTFGCFNNFCKLTPPTLAAWLQVLQAVPTSELLLFARAGDHQQRLRDLFTAQGIASQRIRFVGWGGERYFELYQQIDISLDPWPFTGSTTTCDALWMGVPVVSRDGPMIVSRLSSAILSALGLPELVAHSSEEYVRIAVALAQDLPRLTHLRATLRERLQQSPLMDAPRFARHIESAYRQIWRTWCTS